ncbi:MAG: exodeoxyribonuclease VII large subunit [Caldilineaceae bacterium]
MTTQPITVSTLSSYIVQLFERDDTLRDLWVIGEVSNWKRAASGHVYFSLKDRGATIAAVMWKSHAIAHSWLPNEGDQIIAHGYVGVYPERGSIQLYVNRIQPAGRGQLYAQFEALKMRLAAEGLFDGERKRMLVQQPKRIGVITSADAAALRDILRVLAARWPLVEIILFPTLVQGSEAPAQIVAALQEANGYSTAVARLDTLILARGGGSIEDLWSFNDEQVAYAVAASAIPIVVGVGHETDFTIVDFVADLRAPTPSAAAAAVVPDRQEAGAQLDELRRSLLAQAMHQLAYLQQQIQHMQVRLRQIAPQRQLDFRRQRLDDRSRRLHELLRRHLERKESQLRTAAVQLQALSPHSVLQRGYSIVQREDGVIVAAPAQAAPGTRLQVHTAGGPYYVRREE